MKQNLVEILLTNKESKELDYKAPCSWNSGDKKALCELVKDILAFGNTKGGYLVIGVHEKNNGWEFEGLSDDQLATFDTTKVNQFINKYADPPINVSVEIVRHQNKSFIIIGVPKFADTPHICQKDFPGVLYEATVYVRTDNNESAPIKKSSDFRMLLESALSNRSEQLLKSFRTILKHGESHEQKKNDEDQFLIQSDLARQRSNELNPIVDKNYGYRETIFYPSTFEENAFDLDQLKKMAHQASVNYTGWPFLYINENDRGQSYVVDNGLETLIAGKDVFHGGDGFYFWKFFRSGLLYTNELFLDDSYLRAHGKEDKILDFDRLSQMAGLAVDCLCRLYKEYIDDETEINMHFKLRGLKDKFIGSVSGNRMFFRGIYVSKISETTFSAVHSRTEWNAGLIDHAIEICNHVLQRFNWSEPNLDACRKIIENMLQRKLR
jgi:hypothetical protein